MIVRRFAWTALVCALLGGGVAEAKDYTVTVGAKTKTGPPYEGSDLYTMRFAPTLSIRPAGRPYRFTPPDNGTTLSIIDTKHFEIGPMARFRRHRPARGALTGLREVKWAAEPGVFVDIWPVDWLRLRGEARHGVGGHKGFVGDVGFDLVHTGPVWSFSVGGRTGWGDKTYIDQYFGVTAEEALRSPMIDMTYLPKGGRRYHGIEIATAYRLSDQWRIKADVGYRRLAEKAADSPIVAVSGARNQYSGSVGIAYSFNLGL